MKYKEITVYTSSEAADLVADLLFNECGGGVCIYDKNDIIQVCKSDIIWDYIDESLISGEKGFAAVKGFIPIDNFDDKIGSIKESLEILKQKSVLPLGSMEITVRVIDDNDWYQAWKKHFKPIKIGDLTICPVWCSPTGNNRTVYIDPGEAFGTGEHETTRMCLELLQEYDLKGKIVADIGCGSGILGVSAVICGAEKAYLCDIDTVAVSAAKKCVKLNKVSHKAFVSREIPDNIKADIILMNIVADVIIGFTRKVKMLSAEKGMVILSGIIESKINDVIKAYEDNGFTVDKKINYGDWYAVSLKNG